MSGSLARVKLGSPHEPKTYMKANESRSTSATTKPALSDLSRRGVKGISAELRQLLADVFALYVKTKSFHWHMTGPHFRDYHLMLDDQGPELF
jgi:starvation-inducible DNA-binding protein